jgi:hypothetical protein
MRHLFRQPAAILLLTYFVIQPAGFRPLIQRAGDALLFRPRQPSTRRAVPVATIAAPADHDLSITTLALEDPAIWFPHL